MEQKTGKAAEAAPKAEAAPAAQKTEPRRIVRAKAAAAEPVVRPVVRSRPPAQRKNIDIMMEMPEGGLAVPAGWSGGGDGGAGRRRRRRWAFFFLAVLPSIFVFIFLFFYASPMYVSEAGFAVRSRQTAPAADAFSMFRASFMPPDAWIVRSYIESPDMFAVLNSRLNLVEHYRDRTKDVWQRLWEKPTSEEIGDFWQDVAEAKLDPDTGVMRVTVRAFDPQTAKCVCEGILDESEKLVNRMNDRAREDAISLARDEVARAEKRVLDAKKALQAYREKTRVLDFKAQSSGLYELVNNLEKEVAAVKAELSEAKTYMDKDSPRVKALQRRLAALEAQLEAEKPRLAGELHRDGDASMSSLAGEFQTLLAEEEFAGKQLASAQAALEQARLQAESQTLYIEPFARPVLPDESLYPRPFLFTLAVFGFLSAAFAAVSLLGAAVRDHAGF